MEPLYYQKWNSLNRSKWNTHQNGILIKMEHSSKMELILISKPCIIEWNSPHQQAMDYREEPWILIQRLVENH